MHRRTLSSIRRSSWRCRLLDKTSKARGVGKTKVKAAKPRARARRPRDSAGPLERAVLSRETESWDAFRRQGGDASAGRDVSGKGIAIQKAAKDSARLRLVSLDALKESEMSIQRAAAKLALARAIDARKGLAAAIRNGAPVVITIDVSDPVTLNHIEDCWPDVIFRAKAPLVSDLETANLVGDASHVHAIYLFVREPAKARLAEKRHAAALAALASARPVITFSPLAQSHLPDILLKSRGVTRLTVAPPDARMICDIVRIVIGETIDDLLEPELAALTGLDELGIAIRRDRTASECMSELRLLASAKVRNADARDLTLDQMFGMDAAVAYAKSLVKDINSHRRGDIPFNAISAGVCFEGPTGTGKTTLARVIAREAGCELVVGGFSRWIAHKEGHLGDFTSAMLKDFEAARAKAQTDVTLLFIDEVDSFVDRDSLDGTNGRAWLVAAVAALLAAMDSLSGHGDGGEAGDGRTYERPKIIFIAATNNAARCDPAILRAGRFNRVIRIELPDAGALEQMMRVRLKADLIDEDLSDIAMLATGFTGADVESRVHDARRFARHDNRDLSLDDLKRAFLGEVQDLSASQRQRVAVHEAAHLLVDVLLHGPDGALATMASNGNRLAAAFRLKQAEDYAGTFDDHFKRIQVLLAGRMGEAEVCGAPSHGGGGDLQQATSLAVAMAASCGLAGPPIFLGPATDTERLLGFPEVRAAAIKLLQRAEESCRQLIASNRAALDEVAARLLADGRVDGDDVARIAAARSTTLPKAIDDCAGNSATESRKDPK
jgi:cell division protease FtsH